MKDYSYVDYVANLVEDLSGVNPFDLTRKRPVVVNRLTTLQLYTLIKIILCMLSIIKI